MSLDRHRELYTAFLLELWHADPPERQRRAQELVAPEFVVRRRGGVGTTRGPQAITEIIEQSAALFDNISVTLDPGPIADGDLVAGRWTFTGDYTGGIPTATAEPGTPVSFSGIEIVRISEGMIAEYWLSADTDHLMAQLGG